MREAQRMAHLVRGQLFQALQGHLLRFAEQGRVGARPVRRQQALGNQ